MTISAKHVLSLSKGNPGRGRRPSSWGTVCLSPDPFTLHLPPSSPSSAQDDKHGDGQAMGVKITDTTLRDAHQSLLATRMRTEDMLPIAEEIDSVGYHSVEIWGGATFDTALRLLRGQNVVGYRHYADDVVEKFVELAVKNGMDIFRIFDAVNDLRNLETAIRAVKRAGGHVQGTICYTISPAHTVDMYVKMAKELVEMGSDSICLKDMAGRLHPHHASP